MAEESTVQLELTLTLPASLAREAEAQGLLTSPMLEALLRAEVQRRQVAHLFEAADRLAALPLAPLTKADVEAEIHAAPRRKACHPCTWSLTPILLSLGSYGMGPHVRCLTPHTQERLRSLPVPLSSPDSQRYSSAQSLPSV